MGLTDLLDRDIPIRIEGRDFILRRITLRAVLKILVRFSEELDAFARSEKRDVEGLLAGIDNDSMADLFAFLLDPYDPIYLRTHINAAVARELTVLIGGLNDLGRIWNSLEFSKPSVQSDKETEEKKSVGPAEQIPPMLSVIDLIAERYGIDPLRVLDWPYEAFLTITEVMEAKMEGVQRKQLRDLLSSLGLSPEIADLPGVEFSPVANDLTKAH